MSRAITCWSPRSKPVKYTNYKPLRNKNEEVDQDHNDTIERIGYDTVSFETILESEIEEDSNNQSIQKFKNHKKKNNRRYRTNEVILNEQNNILRVNALEESSFASENDEMISSDMESEDEVISVGLAERGHYQGAGAWWYGFRR